MQLVLLLLLSLFYSEGRPNTFQPLAFYHFPTIPSQSPYTAVSPLQVPISPRLLLYPSSKQSWFNLPFPSHEVYAYFLTPSGNVLTTPDDLQRGVGPGNKVNESPLIKASSVPEQLPTTNEDEPVQEDAPFVLEQPVANAEVPIQEEALTSDAGFGTPWQTTEYVLPRASSYATTNLLTPVSVSQQDSSRIQTEDGLGGYHFRYSEGSSSRDETRDHKGTVRGSYGVMDPSGKVRTYHYIAGTGGFQISGPGLPSQPPLKIPATNEIITEPEKISIPEAIWHNAIQEEVHPFPVESEPSSLNLESRQSESLSVNDLNAIEGARNNVQLAHPYMSQAAYEAVYGTSAVSVPDIAPVPDKVQNDQSSAIDSATREPAELGEVVPTTTEADAIETTTAEPFAGLESSTAEPRPTPWEHYQAY